MKILFRVDCNKKIGIGHLSRCYILAKELKKKFNHKIYFLTVNYQKNIFKFDKSLFSLINIKTKKKLTELNDFHITNKVLQKEKINNIILDHYDLKQKWCSNIRQKIRCFIIIDDGLKKNYECNLYINSTFPNNIKKITSVTRLVGLKYFFLDNYYNSLKTNKKKHNHDVFINLGSGDFNEETLRLLELLNKIGDIKKVLIIGHYFNLKLKKNNFNFKIDIIKKFTHLGDFIKNSKLCIGSGGVNMLERISINNNNIVFATAKHQLLLCDYLHKRKIINFAGDFKTILKINKHEMISNKIKYCLTKWRSINNQKIIDGKGLMRTSKMINKIINAN
mgnify:CR=1 FL=1